ncbi:hypothetical protein DFH06DRAFT_1314139 [Mycena polygramma]|nr:hypothetical protein DFH06DRAFT_1314139 [Mycena polygramma]
MHMKAQASFPCCTSGASSPGAARREDGAHALETIDTARMLLRQRVTVKLANWLSNVAGAWGAISPIARCWTWTRLESVQENVDTAHCRTVAGRHSPLSRSDIPPTRMTLIHASYPADGAPRASLLAFLGLAHAYVQQSSAARMSSCRGVYGDAPCASRLALIGPTALSFPTRHRRAVVRARVACGGSTHASCLALIDPTAHSLTHTHTPRSSSRVKSHTIRIRIRIRMRAPSRACQAAAEACATDMVAPRAPRPSSALRPAAAPTPPVPSSDPAHAPDSEVAERALEARLFPVGGRAEHRYRAQFRWRAAAPGLGGLKPHDMDKITMLLLPQTIRPRGPCCRFWHRSTRRPPTPLTEVSDESHRTRAFESALQENASLNERRYPGTLASRASRLTEDGVVPAACPLACAAPTLDVTSDSRDTNHRLLIRVSSHQRMGVK